MQLSLGNNNFWNFVSYFQCEKHNRLAKPKNVQNPTGISIIDLTKICCSWQYVKRQIALIAATNPREDKHLSSFPQRCWHGLQNFIVVSCIDATPGRLIAYHTKTSIVHISNAKKPPLISLNYNGPSFYTLYNFFCSICPNSTPTYCLTCRPVPVYHRLAIPTPKFAANVKNTLQHTSTKLISPISNRVELWPAKSAAAQIKLSEPPCYSRCTTQCADS